MLRAWAAEHGGQAPRCGDWGGKSSHRDYLADRGRWPTSATVLQAFGSWQAACTAAGLTQRPSLTQRTANTITTKPEILSALRAWAAEHDGYAPRVTDWAKTSSSQLHADYTAQRDRWPTGQAVLRAFRTWQAACAAAGVQPRPIALPGGGWPPAEVIAALRAWAREHEGWAPRYCDWHATAAHSDYLADRQRWPCATTVVRVCGSWTAACRQANLTQRPTTHPKLTAPTAFLSAKRGEIDARLRELRPLINEYQRLQAAAAALDDV